MNVPIEHPHGTRGLTAVLIATVALTAAAIPALAAGRGSPVAADAPYEPGAATASRGTVRTSDGLALTVNTDGTVGAVKDGSRTLPRAGSPGGFSIRMAGGQPNLLQNAGFESGTSGWAFPSSGSYRPTVVTDQHRSGTRSARIAIAGTGRQTSPRATQTVSVTPGTVYVISGWSRTVLLGPNSTETTAPLVYKPDVAPAKIRVELLDSRGRVTRPYSAFSYTGSTDWSQESLGVRVAADERQLRIALVVERGYGSVWWDDVSISRLLAPSTSSLTGTETKFLPGGPGTSDDKVTQKSNIAGQPLQLTATYETFKDDQGQATGMHILGKVRHTGGGDPDRGFQVTYTLPIDAAGWRYGDTPRVARVIANGQLYTFDNGSLYQAARYPWATITDAGSDISLGAPLADPRAFTFSYDTAHGLSITFDLGVSTAAAALQRSATFEIELFRAAPGWGFRSAIARYYALNATTFARRPEITPAREGIAFYSPPMIEITTLAAQKLHLGLNVVGLGYSTTGGKAYAVWDERNGRNIVSAAYTHHWGYFGLPTCRADCTYQQVLAYLDKQAALHCQPTATACLRNKQEAAAAKHATAKDLNGRLRYDFFANAYRLREMADPAMPGGPGGVNWSDTVQTYQLQTAKAEATSVGATLDAIYVDSSSGMRAVWGNSDDYDRTHWARTTLPLTFSYDSGMVTMKSFFANYLQLRRTAAWAHANGIVLVLDTNGKEQTQGGILATDMADWMLIENSLRDLENPAPQSGITTDSYAILKRVLAYQRPIVTVDPKLADLTFGLHPSPNPPNLVADGVVSRINQSLFYGIWPGPERWDSGNKSKWWRNPSYIAIYGAYGPLFQQLAASGWEPVTNATAANPRLWLERYGKAKDDDLVIALRNETNVALNHVKVTVDLTKDGTSGGHISSAHALQRVARAGLGISGATLNASHTTFTFYANVPARTTGLVTIALTLVP